MSFPKNVEKIDRGMRPHTSEAITSEVYFIGWIIREQKDDIKKETAFFIEALIIECALKILEYI